VPRIRSKLVKHFRLFAKTKAEKQEVLTELVAQSEVLTELAQAVSQQVSQRCGRVKRAAAARLTQLVEVARTLLPQIQQWLATGKVATEKLLHAGIPAARAIARGSGQVKFGRKWLINRLAGGYVFGARVAARADENKMPEAALPAYRRVFGAKATPQLLVSDRGASLAGAPKALKQAGVRQVGIPPRGQGAWLVGKPVQQTVKSERGKTDGSLGRLKHTKYGFSHRQERSLATQDAVGQRAIVSANLNTLLRDLLA
jgi:hypothetical protein